FAKADALARFSGTAEFEALVTAYERAANLAAKGDADDVDAALFETEAEADLFSQVQRVEERLASLTEEGRWDEALRALAGLRPFVDRLFDDVMIMAPDPAVRRNRLRSEERRVGAECRASGWDRDHMNDEPACRGRIRICQEYR